MDHSSRAKPERSETFKKKSFIGDRRSLRAHRRSIEWKQMRQDTVNQTRRLDSIEMSPVKELNHEEAPTGKANVAFSRKDKLKRWREEKDLKKKLDAKTKHQTFKVAHIQPELVAFSKRIADLPKVLTKSHPASRKATTVPHAPKVAAKTTVAAAGKRYQTVVAGKAVTTGKPAAVLKSPESAAPARRLTRSQTARSAPPAAPANTRTTKHRSTEATSKAATSKAATSKAATSKAATSKAATSKEATSKAAKPAHPTAAKSTKFAKKVGDHVTTSRGNASFAPTSFQFTAPDSLNSFTFKPLSPSSAAQFLLGKSALAFSPLPTRRCSTPVLARPSRDAPTVLHSPAQSAIPEVRSSASEDDAAVPVMVLSKKKAVAASITSAAHKKSMVKKSISKNKTAATSVVSEADPSKKVEPRRKSSRKSHVAKELKNKRQSSRTSMISPILGSEASESEADMDHKTTLKSPSGSFIVSEVSSGSNSVLKANTPERKSARMSVIQPEAVEEKALETSCALKSRRSSRKSVFASVQDAEIRAEDDSSAKAETPKRKGSRKSVIPPALTSDAREISVVEPAGNVDKAEVSHKVSQAVTPRRQSIRKCLAESTNDTMGMKATIDDDVLDAKKDSVTNHAFSKFDGCTPGSLLPGSLLPGSILRAASGTGRKHGHSMSVSFTPTASLTTLGGNRCSLLLRHMSPEESMEVLKNSPMVQMERRSNKKKSIGGGCGIALPIFDDMDDLPPLASDSASNIENVKPEEVDSLLLQLSTSHTEPATTAAEEEKQVTDALPAASLPLSEASEDVHDVAYFRRMVAHESKLLDDLCDKWTKVQDGLTGVSEEVSGQIRTVIGKAQLLTGRKGRFTQFISLVDACEFKTGELKTKEQDLQGFWDMVFFQVEDVYAMFGDLDKLRDQNWQMDVSKPKKVIKKVVKKKPVNKATTVSAKPRGPSKFAAFRAQMKQQQLPVVVVPDEVVPAMEMTEAAVVPPKPIKTFEAGFFRIQSPVRSPEYHCKAGTPNKSPPAAAAKISSSSTPSSSSRRSEPQNTLMRAALERSARKSSCRPFLTAPQANHSDDQASPSKKQCVTPVTSSSSAVEETVDCDNEGVFTPAPAEASYSRSSTTRRSSARRSIDMDADANSSFSKFLVPTAGTDGTTASESEALMELSLNMSPAGAPFADSPAMKPSLTPQPSRSSPRRSSVVGVRRRHSMRRSVVTREISNQSPLHSPATTAAADSKLRRVSCFTPPTKLATPERAGLEDMEEEEGEQTVNLMCFSPLPAAADAADADAASNSGTQSSSTRSRESSRISLL